MTEHLKSVDPNNFSSSRARGFVNSRKVLRDAAHWELWSVHSGLSPIAKTSQILKRLITCAMETKPPSFKTLSFILERTLQMYVQLAGLNTIRQRYA